MIRTKKKTIKMKSLAICLAVLMVVSISASIFNVVLATGTGAIQVSGMSSIGIDGYATYKAMTGPDQEAGRIIGISVSESEGFLGSDADMGTMLNDAGGNKYLYQNLTAGTYTFKAEVYNGYTLSNVIIGEAGEQGGTNAQLTLVPETTNQYTFSVTVTDGKTVTVNPSFSYNGGQNPPPPIDPGTGGENPAPQASDMQIWVDGVTGTGLDGAVIDTNANPPANLYTGTGFKINTGREHSNYELIFTAPNVTAPAIRLEGSGILSIIPYTNNADPDTVYTSKINSNIEGYSIYSENSESNIQVETMQGEGNGNLALAGGVDIKGGFAVSDHDIQIGTEASPSTKGIKAKNIVVDYAQLKMYCTDTIFDGISETNKMDINVQNTAKLIASTTLSTGTALNNVGKLSVLSGGDANITCAEGCILGTLNKEAKYYDFVNFETTQSLTGMETGFENIVTVNAVAPGDGKYYSITETSRTLHLTSLSKALYTLSYNMTDFNGEIVEDTRVAHGTVRVKTACGIGFGANGRTCNDFRIEEGTPVTIELLPDYGYQFTSGSLNGTAMTTAQEGIATYSFNMPANHLHLSAIFTPVDDSIVINNDEIVGASIGNLAGQINGTAEFKVETVENVDEGKFEDAVEGATIAGFTELSLNQVVLKGNVTDSWKTGITDLEEPMNVSLQVSDDMAAELEKGNSVGVLRDHNGEVSLLEATYNKDTKQLEFDTDGYSTYAIVYSATEIKAKSENTASTDVVKTGDVVLLVAIPTIILVVVANIMVTNRKRNLKKRK